MFWCRHTKRLPDQEDLHQAVLAWMSDSRMVSTIQLPHQTEWGMSLSLDHSIHFHATFRADDWLLFHTATSLTAGEQTLSSIAWRLHVVAGARGLARTEVYTFDEIKNRQGYLVATITQEALIRPNRAAPIIAAAPSKL